jgi:glycosyltransferase involved in cell wall biosynthesis
MLEGSVVAVVVPAFNEERLLGRTLASIPPCVDHVVVVDDGSTDGTREAAEASGEARLHLVRHDENRGVGAAIASGYARAHALGADVVAVMAGDAQMHPGDLLRVLEPVLAGRADYVKGNRLSHPAVLRRMPLARLFGNHVLTWLTRLATGLRVQDSQCGYTALSCAVLPRLPLDELWRGYGYPNDLLGWLARCGARIAEVPVQPIYADERSGIRLYHALLVVPFVLARVALRRLSPATAPRLLSRSAPRA